MAVQRDRPYGNFNFIVEVDGVDLGGFAEVTPPELSIDVIEYREGGAPLNAVRKLPGLARYTNLTLKRGLAGALNLYQWVDEVRNGDANAYRTVVIVAERVAVRNRLELEADARLACEVRFSTLDAKGKDVEVEILELAVERVEIE